MHNIIRHIKITTKVQLFFIFHKNLLLFFFVPLQHILFHFLIRNQNYMIKTFCIFVKNFNHKLKILCKKIFQ